MHGRIGYLAAAALLVAALACGCPADKTVNNTYSMPQIVQIQTTYLPDAAQGELYSVTLEAAGGSGSFVWSIQPGGLNDSWLTIDPATGELTGTSSTVLAVTINIRAQDASDSNNFDNARFTFNVAVFTPTLLFTTADPLPAAGVDQPYSQTLAVSGGSGTYTFSKRTGGTNDSWITVNATGGAVTGTPTATGTTQLIIRAVDNANPLNYVQKTYTIEIKNVAITTSSLPGAYIGQAYSQTIAAQGGSPPYTWSIRPGGVNYAWLSINPSSGLVTGNPTITETGAVALIVRVSDSSTNYDIRLFEFSATAYNPPVIASTTLANAFVNEAYSRQIPVSGGSGPLKYTITGGTNQSWLTLNDSTGLLTGTPDDSNAGAVSISVKVEEVNNPSVFDTGTLSFSVIGVRVTTYSMPDAAVSQAYSFQIKAEGGSGYYVWAVNAAGSSNYSWGTLNQDNGTFAGTAPATVGQVVLAVDIEDSLNPGYVNSAVFRFNIVNLIYSQGFESGIPGTWTANGDWAAGIVYAYYVGPYPAIDGTRVAGTGLTGNYGQNRTWGSCNLTTQSIALPASANRIMLSYWQWFQTEPGDGGVIAVNDSVTGWSQPIPAGGYNGKVDPAVQNVDGFTGFGGAWRRIFVDVSVSQSHSIQVRWSFFSDNDATLCPGWYIDDVRIYEVSSTSLPVKVQSPSIPDGSTYAPPEAGDFATAFTLSWGVSDGATSYDLFAGTDYTTVQNATVPLASPTSPTYTDSAGTFSAGSTYYWRVDAENASGTTKGDVWSFTASNPVSLLINECNPYHQAASTPAFVEIYNCGSICQNVGGWTLTIYGGGVLRGTYTFPAGTILEAGALIMVMPTNSTASNWTPYSGYKAQISMFAFGWADGTSEGEAILRDTSGNGIDYVGFNVVTSHLPADLFWTGSLTATNWWYGFYRNKATDTDSSGDWTSVSPWSLTGGSKNPGQ